MPTITLPALKWGKRKERSQMSEIFTLDGKIVEREILALRACLDDPDFGNGFLADAGNQYKAENGKYTIQLLQEHSAFPLTTKVTRNWANFTKLVDQLWIESKSLAISAQYSKNLHNPMTTFLWIISIVFGSFVVVAGMRYFS